MNTKFTSASPILTFLTLVSLTIPGWAADATNKTDTGAAGYEHRQQHDPNGIGKFYMGREIARVMGHQAADWLERPEREEEEKPELLLQALKLRPGDTVADIGAGTGYYSWRMAKLVRDQGVVYAVDIQQDMLDLLAKKMAERKITNVKGVLGTITDPKLPANSVDLVLMVDVYHEFDHPFEMMQAICRALKPGGRVVFVEFRAEDPKVPIKEVHKMSEAQVRKEMSAQRLEWVETIETLPWQHIIIFKNKRGIGGPTGPKTKSQTPSSSPTPSSKFHNALPRHRFGAWNFELLWCLEPGFWSFDWP